MAVSSKLESEGDAAPKIPVDAEIVLLPEFDPELKEFNRRVGMRFFDKAKKLCGILSLASRKFS